MPEHEGKECSNGKGVGGMRTYKAIKSATTCNVPYHKHDFWIVGGTESCHPRFNEGGTYLVGKQDAQTNSQQYAQSLLDWAVAKDHKYNHKQEQQPRKRVAELHHYSIKQGIVALVDIKEQFRIEGGKCHMSVLSLSVVISSPVFPCGNVFS
jgi:hypothetical protein